MDEILADEQVSNPSTPGNVLWPLTDNQGTVRDLATYDSQNDVTTIANHRTYGAYGQMTGETNSAVDCVFGYTGRLYDEASGLQNNLNRWYDAGVGKWLSEDPIGYRAGDANLYRYCGNGPMEAVDPLGLHEHHWLPQMGGRGQAYVDKLCKKCGVRINDFTTFFEGGMEGKKGDPVRTAHNATHYLAGYNIIAAAIYKFSKSCCQMLVSFDLLRRATILYLQALDQHGFLDPKLPASLGEMHPYRSPKPWQSTNDKWNELLVLACPKDPSDWDKPPAEVQVLVDELNRQTWKLSPKLVELYMHEPGAKPTYDELKAGGIAGLVRGLIARAATRAAAGAAGAQGAGTGAAGGATAAAKTIEQILKAKAAA